MTCHNCESICKKSGKHRNGLQRFRCNQCKRTFTEEHERPEHEMRLSQDKALMCLHLLVEGMSVRSIQRITGVHRDTVLDLMVRVGEKCEALMESKLRKVKVSDIQLDEIWSYVEMKEKTKNRKGKGDDAQLGDAYTFVAFERDSKLILAWHLGRRTSRDTLLFTEKIFAAVDGTQGRIQVTTDGFPAYPDAVAYSLGTRADYSQLIKIYGAPEPDEHRYSPSHVIEAIPTPVFGNPDPEKICTSHVERQNLNIRMAMRRFTRLTNAFSKKWSNLKAALALYFAYYNFCRIHSSIRCTPAMEAGITKHVWELKDLLTA
jgi:transposase-like protein/IS1 family transposase